MSWVPRATDRRVRILQALASSTDGLSLEEVGATMGEWGRRSKSYINRLLRVLREEKLVAYTPPPPGQERTHGGLYAIDDGGRDWLEAHGFSDAGGDDEAVHTGAMYGDVPTVLQTTASAGQAPAGALSFVFDLGRGIQAP